MDSLSSFVLLKPHKDKPISELANKEGKNGGLS